MFKLKLGPLTVYRGPNFAEACEWQDRFEFLRLYQLLGGTWHLLEI